MDRWLTSTLAGDLRHLQTTSDPVVVDLGYGAAPVTVIELASRLRTVHPRIRVAGVEIDPERVANAQPFSDPPGVQFVHGGFDCPMPPGLDGPLIAIRAANVLRQYDEYDVRAAWRAMATRLVPGGLLQEGTCDELGRLCAWVAIRRPDPGSAGDDLAWEPETLTLAWKRSHLDPPSTIAERLPKALIHRNVPGEPIHAFLQALDRAWQHHAALAGYGVRQRFQAMARSVAEAGWPIQTDPKRWRLGEITVPWGEVAPRPAQLY